MVELFSAFWQICRFRKGPQDLPASNYLLGLVLLAYTIVSAVAGILSLSPAPVLSSIVDTALTAGLTWLMLWLRQLTARFVQTLIALAGTGMILGLVLLPLLWWRVQVDEQAAFLPSLLMLGVFFWNLALIGHILRHALNTYFFVGVAVALLYMYVSLNIIRVLFVTPS